MTIEAIKQLLQPELDALNAEIVQQLETPIDLINQLAHYIIDSGGKRMRPMLTLLTTKALHYRGNQQHILATLIEFIHTATLLHDDVVDDSELRRGNETANHIWGNEASVLVGDYLFSRAFQMIVTIDQSDIFARLSSTTNKLAIGEVTQLMFRHNPEIDESTYFSIIEAKTAKLFAAACSTAGMLCNADKAIIDSLDQYGTALGMAFQLIDDALDYQGNTELLGKNLGDDLAEGKVTLPIIRCLQQSPRQQKELIRQCIMSNGSANLNTIQQAIASTDAIEYTYMTGQRYINDALTAIQALPASEYQQALIDLAHFAVNRNS